jgi:hypothetical protein
VTTGVPRFLDARAEVAGPRGCPRREFPDRPDPDRTRCHRLVGVRVSSPAEKLGLPSFSVVEPMGVAGGRGGLIARSALRGQAMCPARC